MLLTKKQRKKSPENNTPSPYQGRGKNGGWRNSVRVRDRLGTGFAAHIHDARQCIIEELSVGWADCRVPAGKMLATAYTKL